jgi:hypothetical protein
LLHNLPAPVQRAGVVGIGGELLGQMFDGRVIGQRAVGPRPFSGGASDFSQLWQRQQSRRFDRGGGGGSIAAAAG